LLVAGTVLVLIGGAMSTLAYAVYASYEVCRDQSQAAQHARVSLDRIERAVSEATASESFPGCLIVNFTADGYTFPDSLAVWRPSGTAADPTGLPRVNELIVFSCTPSEPNKLLEMTWPANTSAAPAASNQFGWRALIDSFHSSTETVKNQLTDRLHVGRVDTTPLIEGLLTTRRGMIRFKRMMAPRIASGAPTAAGSAPGRASTGPSICMVRKLACARSTCKSSCKSSVAMSCTPNRCRFSDRRM
jgi:hypothetical protein